jgi:DNA repair ATPase RecN
MSLNQILSTQDDVEELYNTRRLIYESKDIFYEIATNTDVEEDPECKEISDIIIKGKKKLQDSITEHSKLSFEKQKLDDAIKVSKNSAFDIQQRLDYLKQICQSNNVEVENLHDTMDQITFLMLYITDSMEANLNDKRKTIEDTLQTVKGTLKSLGNAYGILRNCNVSSTCPICMNHQLEVVLIPCGHQTCANCVPSSSFCYFCRSRIEKISRMFSL